MNQDLTLATAVAHCSKACKLLTDRGGLTVPAMPGKNYKPGGLALFAEAPGADEEKPYVKGAQWGAPMVGRAGKLANTALFQAGLNRDDVLVLNRIRCRPPRNRIADYPDAVLACDEWVRAELEHYQPSVVILMGRVSGELMFGPKVAIGTSRGTIRQNPPESPYGSRAWVLTYHPAAALRNPAVQPMIVEDLLIAKDLL